jgi:hypothetical protein
MAWWHTDGEELAHLIYEKLKERKSLTLNEVLNIIDTNAKFGLKKTMRFSNELLEKKEDVERIPYTTGGFDAIIFKMKE